MPQGLDQKMNESWVSAVLWELATHAGSGAPIHRGLMAPEMRTPYASGYVGTYWWEVDHSCQPIDPISSEIDTPILSDLLNGLTCAGFPADSVSAVVSEFYPFDAEEPSCK